MKNKVLSGLVGKTIVLTFAFATSYFLLKDCSILDKQYKQKEKTIETKSAPEKNEWHEGNTSFFFRYMKMPKPEINNAENAKNAVKAPKPKIDRAFAKDSVKVHENVNHGSSVL